MNTFEMDITYSDMEYPVGFDISLYKEDSYEYIKDFHILYYKELNELLIKLNNKIKERHNKPVPFKLIDYIDAKNGDEYALKEIYGAEYIDTVYKICDLIIMNNENKLYSNELLKINIKEKLARYFNTTSENVQLYSDTTIKNLLEKYSSFPFDAQRRYFF